MFLSNLFMAATALFSGLSGGEAAQGLRTYHCKFDHLTAFYLSEAGPPVLPAYECREYGGSIRLYIASKDFRAPYATSYGPTHWIEELDVQLRDSLLTRVLPGHFSYVGDLDRLFVPRRGLQFQSPSLSVNGISVLSAL